MDTSFERNVTEARTHGVDEVFCLHLTLAAEVEYEQAEKSFDSSGSQ